MMDDTGMKLYTGLKDIMNENYLIATLPTSTGFVNKIFIK